MNALPFAFGAPMILAGLIALPVIWWLLRMTPPRPQEEVFPPLRILANVLKKEETPSKSPWWMTLLRLLLAALVILALAEPVWNPRPVTLAGKEPVAIVLDNGWASAENWNQKLETAERLVTDAEASGALIYVMGTAERTNVEIGPFDAPRALERLQALKPRPIPVNRQEAFNRLSTSISATPGARVAYLNDGIETADAAAALASLDQSGASSMLWYRPDTSNLAALTSVENGADGLVVHAVRPSDASQPRSVTVGAFDTKGRRIAETSLAFAIGSSTAEGRIEAPIELRNDFSFLRIDGASQAAATRLLDSNAKRRRVALLSGADADSAQPLLSPLYYISRALNPYADLVQPRTADLAVSVPELLEQNPSVVVMADIGKLPEAAEQRLADWVAKGGTLIRFAGPKLAGASDDDTLLPVTLRRGERSLGGTLSWTEPQPLAAFPAAGPFAGLPTPRDVTVTRQVLAEPSPGLFEKSWANLADGTPLVTGETRGSGRIVLFHVAPNATWSNLPISGTFVEMLRRIVALSQNLGGSEDKGTASVSLPPYLMLAADGSTMPPAPETKPLTIGGGATPQVSYDNPPGFYGSEEALYALNLLGPQAKLNPLIQPSLSFPVTASAYAADESIRLRGPLFAAAAILLALDTLLVLWLGGHFRMGGPRKGGRMQGGRKAAALGALALLLLPAVLFASASPFAGGGAMAQTTAPAPPAPPAAQPESSDNVVHDDSRPGDQAMIDAVSVTHLAYIVTGDKAVDDISKAGLQGLTQFLMEKTAMEPGEPIGLDPARDELAFYPLIYWPIDANAPMPSEAAIARIDAYMQQGGTVLFDTRDEFAAGAGLDGSTTPAGQRLRAILDGMNVPPLEPVPSDHVLTKSFYIMPDFPGRYRGSPLWVEASLNSESRQDRPVRTGDGVSPILITANDLAGAWAIDQRGAPLLPTVPNDPMQRAYALRGGVNIMMYMLTGNYKSDQVHVPVLLERLGN
ncbi:DUF4159 domain-containing protein [Phyllobacterium salinisoli]|uniref:DUF4159 domain-containing protein n=1 Tax=Phyllobacterium salinisoli TaxID=1899321 RepID=A0A368KBW5_9HYPH|nr:DUF4159 domain-containing protein [Phyllobacterium salinisoli]RCS25570.1 DUF4159 domain-containing protein [Phyllobacterium salinisoli]